MTYPININVKDYGAKGDGTTCDYTFIKNAVTAINSAGSGTLVFPPGIYLIDKYKITGGPKANLITDIIYQNCTGLSIIGYRATVVVKGDFHRDADNASGKISYSESVVPFSFVNCSNFELRGFELTGSVNVMTRDAAVVEGNCHGIKTSNCSDYTLQNLYVHHFAADGILLGLSSTTADKRAHITSVKSLGGFNRLWRHSAPRSAH
ncbi:MAG: glycosyl hydrolase family 28-related protein [Pseudonocardiaceae bacterium]